MASSRPAVLTVALLVVTLLPRASLAQTLSASDRETARTLMQEGDARRDRKDLKGALESFQAADAIMHVTTTGLEVARTQVQLGLLVEAQDQLVGVLRVPAKPHESPLLSEARVAARALSDDLDARIPGIRVVLHGASASATATVSIDGAVIPPAALVAYRKVNPGHHVVAASVGGAEQHQDVTVKEREQRDVTLDLPSVPAVTAGASPVLPANEPSRVEAPPALGGPWKALTITGSAVGVAGVVVGSITGVISLSKASAAKSVPASQGGCVNDQCGPATHSDIDASVLTGNISTAAFIVGGAGIALGVTSLMVWRGSARDEAREAPRVSLSPWVGPLAGGLSGTF